MLRSDLSCKDLVLAHDITLSLASDFRSFCNCYCLGQLSCYIGCAATILCIIVLDTLFTCLSNNPISRSRSFRGFCRRLDTCFGACSKSHCFDRRCFASGRLPEFGRCPGCSCCRAARRINLYLELTQRRRIRIL